MSHYVHNADIHISNPDPIKFVFWVSFCRTETHINVGAIGHLGYGKVALLSYPVLSAV